MAKSSAEAEHRAMAKEATKLVWMKMLFGELGFPISALMQLWCDSQSAIHIANPVFHERTKHIELDCHFIKRKSKRPGYFFASCEDK